MTSSEILSYLKSQKWFFGVRADASILFYSAKQDGVRRHVKELHGLDFAETMLVPVGGQPVRAINVEQAKAFHEVSRKMVLENPQILQGRIKDNDKLWVRIARECEALDRAVKAGDESAAIEAYKTAAESYSLHGAHFIIIFSLGLKLTESGVTPENKEVLAIHDVWRNTVALKEELVGESWYDFFVFIADRRKVQSSALDLMRFLSLSEVFAWLEGDLDGVDSLVGSRKNHGFVYLDLRQDRRVIDDAELIDAVSAQFSAHEDKAETREIKGQVAFAGEGTVVGRVVVVKGKEELSAKGDSLAGKILVAVQTTPHYIPYLKGVKAIVTDEGGITCHAAIVSREMGIPCIVGTKNATIVLNDGDEVEMDFENGMVKKIQ
jgi:phosphohistidine swiveling domain-containing protein